MQYHDIDQSRHANNTAYLEWMIDAVVPRRLTGDIGTIHELVIDFRREMVVGEVYRTRIADSDGATDCDIIRETDAELICRARRIWKEE
ncbi:MAG: hypothetical protein V3S41_07365 [Spirochaetia bacterium]